MKTNLKQKNNWQTKKLGEVCDIFNGGTPNTKKLSYWGDDHFWITPKDMGQLNDIFVEDTSRKITSAGLKNSSAKILPPNSIILSSRAPIGHLAINKVPMATNQGCKGLITKKELNYFFLFYFLFNSVELLNKLGSGTTFKELSGSKLATIEIPLPPLPEQHRIVKILDEVFADVAKTKENAEKNLQNAKELFESYLQSVFANPENDWEEKILNDVCEDIFAGGDKPKGAFSKFKTDEFQIPIFSNGIKNDGLYGYTNTARIKKPSITISARGTIGYSVIRREAFFPIIRLIVLTPHDDLIDLDFLHYSIKNNSIIGNGTSIPQLTVPAVKKIKVSFPKSLKIQKEIIKKLDELSHQIKKLETIYQQKLANLEELKKSVLKRAFNGDL